MQTILFTVALMGGLMLIMSVGVIFKRAPLKGSCGGVGGKSCLCEEEGTPNACALPANKGTVEPKGKVRDDGVVFYD